MCFTKASRRDAPHRTWAGSGRRLAMDCTTQEKPCLRRCHGITHKQRRTHTELPIASTFLAPPPSADTENTRKIGPRTSCAENLTILADTHECPQRHTHRGLRDDNVPMLHAEPMDAQLRQLRVILQELEQDDVQVVAPRSESKHVDTSKPKAQIGRKGRLNVRFIAQEQNVQTPSATR